ncbi:MAG: GNAT family N-acetyltransferase [Clostridium sp.]|nr:GNAT family N-acetyltransferase [Clostridium sp.]
MLRLRPYKPCDAEAVAGWLKDEYVYRLCCADTVRDYPLTAEALNDFYREQENNDSFWTMTAFDQDGPAGQLVMRFMDEEKKILRLCYIVVDDKKRGRGYGKELVGLAIKFGLEIVKAEKLALGVFENNLPARKCYESMGFKLVKVAEPKVQTFMGEEWKGLEMIWEP